MNMNLLDWAVVPIIVAIVILSLGIIIDDANIEDTEISNFVDNANDLQTSAETLEDQMISKTDPDSLQGFIENSPLIGDLVKTGRFVTGITGSIRTSFNVLVGFLRDSLSSQVIGIPASIVALVLALGIVNFAFAVLNSLKGEKDK